MKIPLPEESLIIIGCLQKDRRSQQSLYEKYEKRMFGICIRYLVDRSEAQDALVCGFLKVFEAIHSFKNTGSFEGWIRQIMVNECLTRLRKMRSLPVINDFENAELEKNIAHDASASLETEDLLALICLMPAGYRTVFNLYAIEGYSHKEIGLQLGIDEQSSKSQLSRARKWLQERIKKSELLPDKFY